MEKSNLETRVEHIEKVVGDIQRDVKGLYTCMVLVESLTEGVSRRIVNAGRKAEKTGNRLWVVVIAAIAAGGISALLSRFLS